MSLLSLQQTFSKLIHSGLDSLVAPPCGGYTGNDVPGRGNDRNYLDFILQKPPLTPSERFSIYQNAYEVRLIESLEEDFPQVKKVLSTDVFCNLGKEYLKSYPSQYWSLAEVGKDFPKFIANANLQYKFLADLAYFEWLKIIACFVADAELFDFSSIAEIAADKQNDIVLKLDSSVSLFKSKWSLHLENITQQDTLYLIYQKQGEALHILLTCVQYDILEKILQGLSIGEIFSTFQDIQEEEITNWFSAWVSEKVISHFKLN